MASTATPERGAAWTRGRHLVGPLILLGAGVLLLLNNLQIVPWSIWRDLWPYWPVLLVLLGLEALVTGRVAWGTLVLLVLLLPILGLVVTASSFAARWHDETRSDAARRQPRRSTTRWTAQASATIQLEYGAGALDIGPLREAPPARYPGRRARCSATAGRASMPARPLQNGRRTLQISHDHAERHVRPRPPGASPDPGHPDRPQDRGRRRRDDPQPRNPAGARTSPSRPAPARRRSSCPPRARPRPRSRGARPASTSPSRRTWPRASSSTAARTAIKIDERRFPRQSEEYRSPDFDTATDRVTLRIEVGASRLVVQ